MRILVIEDDSLSQVLIRSLLKGHYLEVYPSLDAAFEAEAGEASFDVALVDLCHPKDPEGKGTPALIARLRQKQPKLEILVQSAVRDLALMRSSLKHGAQGFLFKEHLADELPAQISILEEFRSLRAELDQLIVGESELATQLKRDLFRLKIEEQGDVLIEGETGSGKELCAQALRGDRPFVAVAASALSKELFESELFGVEKGAFTGAQVSRAGYVGDAQDGILFLDEIQSLHPESQVKLLRFIENREYYRVGSSQLRRFEGRLIFAANENLWELVQAGKFREDFYFRIHARKVMVPPLRQRRADIPYLIAHHARSQRNKKELTPDAVQYLVNDYDWPGNVRELFQTLNRVYHDSKLPLLDADEFRPHLGNSGAASPLNSSVSTHDYKIDWNAGFDENITRFERHLMAQAAGKYAEDDLRDSLQLTKTRYYQKLKLIRE